MDKQVFLETFAPEVQAAVSGTGLFASVKLAQLALETGWGDSIKHAGNNCFGIKASPKWGGKVISNTTNEEIGGVSKRFTGTGQVYESYDAALTEIKKVGVSQYTLFKAYNSISESIADHSKLLLTADRYRAAREAKTPDEQAKLIQQAGYATASNYANLLIKIIKQNGLTKYDV